MNIKNIADLLKLGTPIAAALLIYSLFRFLDRRASIEANKSHL
jgi:hypothetical protein